MSRLLLENFQTSTGDAKKVYMLACCRVKSMWAICIHETKIFLCQSKANLVVKVLFGKISHL